MTYRKVSYDIFKRGMALAGWTLLEPTEKEAVWSMQCNCGHIAERRVINIINGRSQTCNCVTKERNKFSRIQRYLCYTPIRTAMVAEYSTPYPMPKVVNCALKEYGGKQTFRIQGIPETVPTIIEGVDLNRLCHDPELYDQYKCMLQEGSLTLFKPYKPYAVISRLTERDSQAFLSLELAQAYKLLLEGRGVFSDIEEIAYDPLNC